MNAEKNWHQKSGAKRREPISWPNIASPPYRNPARLQCPGGGGVKGRAGNSQAFAIEPDRPTAERGFGRPPYSSTKRCAARNAVSRSANRRRAAVLRGPCGRPAGAGDDQSGQGEAANQLR